MKRVVLFGDLVFDDDAQCRRRSGRRASVAAASAGGLGADLNARDGAVMADIPAQMRSLPADATHVVISVGGNGCAAASRRLG